MKRTILTSLLFLFVAFSAIAVNDNDITFVSYEQSWLDREGTLALKNNTSEDIHNIKFIITYLDMSGNALDYEEFTEEVSIAPGMTKKLDIPAYEQGRHYHYYKTKDEFGNPAFKIKFELQDYNIQEDIADDADDSDDDILSSYNYSNHHDIENSSKWYVLILIMAALIAIGFSVGLYVIVALMAKKRHRNVVLWVLLSIVASPLIIIIILLVIGNDDKSFDSFDNRIH